MNNPLEFLSWLYERCETGNINLRFLGGKFPKNEFIPLASLSEEPWIIDSVLTDHRSLNSYFGVALRNGNNGTNEGITQISTLWADLDGSPLERVAESPWPPSAIIETSQGKYHVYWKLREPADRSEIPAVEDLLRRLSSFFKADPAACDVSRILRIPGTSNFKTTPPHPVQLVIIGDQEWNLQDFDDLPEVQYSPPPAQAKGSDRLKKILECGFLQHCAKERARLPEPEWYAMIGILARETGGPALIHQLSRGYPGYSPRETDQKILHAMNNPPMSCAKIKTLWDCGRDCGAKSPTALPFRKQGQPAPEGAKEAFPQEALGGLAGEFAELFSSYLEVPAHFFFMSFLTCLGYILVYCYSNGFTTGDLF